MREKAEIRLVWEATDSDGVACELVQVEGRLDWQFSLTEGPFSGYPTIDLTQDKLTDLCKTIYKELTGKELNFS